MSHLRMVILKLWRVRFEAGADKDNAIRDGTIPLRIASENGHLENVRVLCQAGADKNWKPCFRRCW